jgi:LPS export ABC transporter permease LptF/LPS export ABC transporter permease LptG
VRLLAGLRPTILDRYVVREVLPPSGLGLLLFTFILVLDSISQLMKILVSRGADLQTVVRAFLYLLPSIFSVTIPMAFLLGVLLAFGRLASDSEIVALRASGVSPLRLLRPVLLLSALAMGSTFFVVAEALPASNQAYRELVFTLMVSKAKSGLQPRVFNDDLIPNIVIYVSDMDPQTGDWRNVFMHDNRIPQKPKVVVARGGSLLIDKERKLVEIRLQQGVTYTFQPATPAAYERLEFKEHDWPLPFDQFFPKVPLAKGDREMTLDELWQNYMTLAQEGKGPKEYNRFLVEFHKKFAIAGACIVFGLLGLGLSLGSKKEARSAAFGLSIGVIFVYYVLIRLGEQAGDTGMMSPFVAMWAANIVLFVVAIVLLVLSQREAAFDPLDVSHYKALLPVVRRPSRVRAGEGVRVPARAGQGPGRGPGGPRKVVVLRIPRLSLPLPGLLDRYVVRAYLGHFGLVVVSFWALFVLISFMDLFDDVQHNKVKGVVMLHYYAFFSPQILHFVTPVAVLVAVLITFGLLSRRNEITAMKAAGISIYRVTLPAVALGLVVASFMFGLSEYVLPPTNKVAGRDHNVIKGRPPQASTTNQHRWILGSDGRFYNYDFLEPRPGGGAALYGLSIYDVTTPDWQLRDVLYVARAAWNGVSYDLERGYRRTFVPAAEFRTIPQARSREIEPPSYFGQEERAADTLRFAELRLHIASLELLGLDVTPLRVQLHRKLAFPVVCVVMTLLGIPFAFVVARRGALWGIAASVVIAIVYWACLSMFDTFGNNGLLPPLLAAWAPNLLFGGSALYLMFTLET